MKNIYLSLIVLIVVILAGYLFIKNKNMENKIEVVETKDFSCQGLSGFSFKYPVFKNWSAGEFEKDGEYDCKMFFENPPEISYEIARQMKVSVIPRTGEVVGERNSDDTTKNKNGVNYKRLENSFSEFPSVYEFYGTDFDVQIGILAGAEKDGFSEKIAWQTIIDSFNF